MKKNTVLLPRHIEFFFYQILLNPLIQRSKKTLQDEENPVGITVSRALEKTMNKSLTEEEMLWIDKIESLRQALKVSDKQITIVDNGAGSSYSGVNSEFLNEINVAARSVGDVCRRSSKSHFWATLLFHLIREFRPKVCVELGTCLGISGAYLAAGLKLNQLGKLVTIEGSQSLASLAGQNFTTLGFGNVELVTGKFQEKLEKVLAKNAPVEFVFIDGHHDGLATWYYFEQIHAFASTNTLLVLDDIRWSKSMKKTWRMIQSDERVCFALDLWMIGICLLKKPGRIVEYSSAPR